MRQVLILSSILFMTAVPALAARPYAGFGLHVTDPRGEFRGSDVLRQEGGAETGFGGRVDVGIMSHALSGYIAYCYTLHSAQGKSMISPSSTLHADGDWTISRFLAGIRVNLLGSMVTSVRPIVGGGLSLGKTTADASATIKPQNEFFMENVTSKSSPGWFLEFGMITRVNDGTDFIGGVQYHEFDASFDTDIWDGTIHIAYYTIQLGIAYML